jgi:starch synthase
MSVPVLQTPAPRAYARPPEADVARIYPIVRERQSVLFVTPEMSDFAQVGGLGAVAASLPRALRRFCDIRVLMPGYRQALAQVGGLQLVAHLPGSAEIPPCSIGKAATADGLVAYFVLCRELYDRDGDPYCDASGVEFSDNDVRFARLSLAAAQLAMRGDGGWAPASLHLNDWQSALAAGYIRWSGSKIPTLLTVHNLAHQGVFDATRLAALAIPPAAFNIDGVEYFGRLSFLKAGMNYATHLTTVSQTYADEITRGEFGCGLDGLLFERALQGRLSGILNGIDESWDPRRDPRCPYLFDANRWKGRYADYIRGAFGLSLSRAPLFSVVSRLVHQKGVDLTIEAAQAIIERGGQLIVMGRGDPDVEEELVDLAARNRDAVGVRIGFDPDQARAIFAASDFVLMPSRFEPCGLSQMYAQRFGALPIAHRTGGLAETIEDGKTGFLFEAPLAEGFANALQLAFEAYGSTKRISDMRRAAMAQKFDWGASAQAYSNLYRQIGATRKV